MKRRIFALIGAFLALSLLPALAQEPGSAPVEVDYNNPQSYVVGGIRISGTKYLGESQLLSVLGIRPGDRPAPVPPIRRHRIRQGKSAAAHGGFRHDGHTVPVDLGTRRKPGRVHAEGPGKTHPAGPDLVRVIADMKGQVQGSRHQGAVPVQAAGASRKETGLRERRKGAPPQSIPLLQDKRILHRRFPPFPRPLTVTPSRGRRRSAGSLQSRPA